MMPIPGISNNLGFVKYVLIMTTVNELIIRFMNYLQVSEQLEQIRPATKDFYQFQLVKLRKFVGDQAAETLKPYHLTEIKLTNHFIRALKRLFQWAVDEEILTRNQFRKLRLPPTGQRTRVLSAEEYSRLLAACGNRFRLFVEFAAETAARPGELRTLLWKEVREKERLIIKTSFKAKNLRRDGKGVRQIPLTRRSLELLSELRPSTYHPDGHVFISRLGKAYSPNAIRCAMRAARERAGLDNGGERVVVYTMRHTRATVLTRRGVQLGMLGEIMGHTNVQQTRRYVHLTGMDLLSAIDAAEVHNQQN